MFTIQLQKVHNAAESLCFICGTLFHQTDGAAVVTGTTGPVGVVCPDCIRAGTHSFAGILRERVQRLRQDIAALAEKAEYLEQLAAETVQSPSWDEYVAFMRTIENDLEKTLTQLMQDLAEKEKRRNERNANDEADS